MSFYRQGSTYVARYVTLLMLKIKSKHGRKQALFHMRLRYNVEHCRETWRELDSFRYVKIVKVS